MNTIHPHEETALAIGYMKRPDGEWLNNWGASFTGSPADLPWDDWKGVLIRNFESLSSFANQRRRSQVERFRAEYRPDMSRSELCDLVLRIART